jgi:hypothetical protein
MLAHHLPSMGSSAFACVDLNRVASHPCYYRKHDYLSSLRASGDYSRFDKDQTLLAHVEEFVCTFCQIHQHHQAPNVHANSPQTSILRPCETNLGSRKSLNNAHVIVSNVPSARLQTTVDTTASQDHGPSDWRLGAAQSCVIARSSLAGRTSFASRCL